MNRLYLIGNLTADAVLAATSLGEEVCTFSLAVNQPASRNARDQSGVTYFRCSIRGARSAEYAKILRKGCKAFVSGEVGASVYRSRDGSARASLEVQCRECELLSGNEA